MQQAKRELRKHMRTVLKGISAESVASQSSVITSKLISLPEYHQASRIGIYLSMPTAEVSTVFILQDVFQKGKDVYVPYIHRVPSPTPQPTPQQQLQSQLIGETATGNSNSNSSSNRESGSSSIMEMLQLSSMEEYCSLPRDNWGIPSLDPNSVSDRRNCLGGLGIEGPSAARTAHDGSTGDIAGGLDLIIMPGMAFDEDNRRLGHGMGYYDRFLSRYNSKSDGGGHSLSKPFLAALAFKEQILPPGSTVPTTEHDYPVDAVITSNSR